jgi:hypothetical protein
MRRLLEKHRTPPTLRQRGYATIGLLRSIKNMKKRLFSFNNVVKIIFFFLTLGIFLTSVISYTIVSTANKNFIEAPTEVPINENNQTYGESGNGLNPDLVLSQGINGVIGYVSVKEISDYIQPNRETKKDMSNHMKKLNKLIQKAKDNNQPYLYYVPVYESDGKTVIDKFGVSIPTVTVDNKS